MTDKGDVSPTGTTDDLMRDVRNDNASPTRGDKPKPVCSGPSQACRKRQQNARQRQGAAYLSAGGAFTGAACGEQPCGDLGVPWFGRMKQSDDSLWVEW